MKETRDEEMTKECEQRPRTMEWRWMTTERRKSKQKNHNIGL